MFKNLKPKTLMFGILLISVIALISTSATLAQDATEEATSMSEDDILTFVEQFDAVFDGPSLDIIDEVFAPDYVGHLPLAPELDREGLKAYIAGFYGAISDLTQEVNDVIIGDDRVVLHVTYSGTHDGPLFGIPATGLPVSMNGIGIFRFDEHGLVAENWAVIDVVNLLAQIGAFPPQPAE